MNGLEFACFHIGKENYFPMKGDLVSIDMNGLSSSFLCQSSELATLSILCNGGPSLGILLFSAHIFFCVAVNLFPLMALFANPPRHDLSRYDHMTSHQRWPLTKETLPLSKCDYLSKNVSFILCSFLSSLLARFEDPPRHDFSPAEGSSWKCFQ